MKRGIAVLRNLLGLGCLALSFVVFIGAANLGAGVDVAPNPLGGLVAVIIGLATWFSGYLAVRALQWERTYRLLTYSFLPLISLISLAGTTDGPWRVQSSVVGSVKQGHDGYVGPFSIFGLGFTVLVLISLVLFRRRIRGSAT